jgi:prevent-host-death family protein
MRKYKIIVGLKELRENTATYVSQVKKGKSFIVVRKSKPLFKISPIDDEDDKGLWEAVVDFTKIKKGGVPILDLLSRL